MPRVRGVDLAVVDTGEGPAVLWGHGFASSVQDEADRMLRWDRISARNRVVRWDARGHGLSTGTLDPDDYRWDNLGRDFVALADALGIERYAVGGVSMGAAAALHAATDAPSRVAGLVLVLPPTAYETRAAQAGEYLTGAALVEEQGADAYVDWVNAQPIPEASSASSPMPTAWFRPCPSVCSRRCSVARGPATSRHPNACVRSWRRHSCSRGTPTPAIRSPPPNSSPSCSPTPSSR